MAVGGGEGDQWSESTHWGSSFSTARELVDAPSSWTLMEPWVPVWKQINTLNATWVVAGARGGPLRFGILYCLLFENSGLSETEFTFSPLREKRKRGWK